MTLNQVRHWLRAASLLEQNRSAAIVQAAAMMQFTGAAPTGGDPEINLPTDGNPIAQG